MALTRSFKELVQRQVASDPEFGVALLREGVDTMLTGDVDTGKADRRSLYQPGRILKIGAQAQFATKRTDRPAHEEDQNKEGDSGNQDRDSDA